MVATIYNYICGLQIEKWGLLAAWRLVIQEEGPAQTLKTMFRFAHPVFYLAATFTHASMARTAAK
jgi:hypothetical protein